MFKKTKKRSRRDSNSQPSAPKADALSIAPRNLINMLYCLLFKSHNFLLKLSFFLFPIYLSSFLYFIFWNV